MTFEIKTNQCIEDCEFLWSSRKVVYIGLNPTIVILISIPTRISFGSVTAPFTSQQGKAMGSRRKERSSQIISDERSGGWDDVDVYIPSCFDG